MPVGKSAAVAKDSPADIAACGTADMIGASVEHLLQSTTHVSDMPGSSAAASTTKGFVSNGSKNNTLPDDPWSSATSATEACSCCACDALRTLSQVDLQTWIWSCTGLIVLTHAAISECKLAMHPHPGMIHAIMLLADMHSW